MGLTCTVPPVLEAVTLAELKNHLRITWDTEDGPLRIFLDYAIETVQAKTWRALLTSTWRLKLDKFPADRTQRFGNDLAIYLPRPPLQSVTSIQYLDTAGDLVTFTDAEISLSEPGRIVATNGWPATKSVPDAVTITFVAGYTSAGGIPKAARAAILLAAGELYEGRENRESIGTNTVVDDLCRQCGCNDWRICDSL